VPEKATTSDGANLDNVGVHHEESDVNVRAIFGSGAALLAMTLVALLGVWWLFDVFATSESGTAPKAPLAVGQTRIPPQPRLQVAPREDLRMFRAQEDARLHSYEWVIREAGVVRIPIDEAIRLTLERGLPARDPQSGAAR
jgi:hypothetical protein